MTKRWHFWLVIAVIVIGLIIVFWPAPVREVPATNGAAPGALNETSFAYMFDFGISAAGENSTSNS